MDRNSRKVMDTEAIARAIVDHFYPKEKSRIEVEIESKSKVLRLLGYTEDVIAQEVSEIIKKNLIDKS